MDGDTGFDVNTFNPTVRFRAEGGPTTDDFILSAASWERLGNPERIRVTVEALTSDGAVWETREVAA